MSTKEVRSSNAAGNAGAARVDMKLEVVVIPVSDIDRAKEFYQRIGWRLNVDRSPSEDFRLVQFTPPGSWCSVHFGKGLTPAAPGSSRGFLIVPDIVAQGAEDPPAELLTGKNATSLQSRDKEVSLALGTLKDQVRVAAATKGAAGSGALVRAAFVP